MGYLMGYPSLLSRGVTLLLPSIYADARTILMPSLFHRHQFIQKNFGDAGRRV